jgi:hypothetical protein
MQQNLIQVVDKLNYSGVQSYLDQIFTVLNYYQTVTKELLHENKRVLDKEDTLGNNAFILQDLTEELDGTLKLTQKETARKVLTRFYRNPKTSDVYCQTVSEESQVKELENIIRDKTDIIKSLNN